MSSGTMKEAMIKAGLISKDSIEREKEKERKQKIEKKGPLQHGIHAHHIRTDCGHCKKNSPDVEFYEHANRSIEVAKPWELHKAGEHEFLNWMVLLGAVTPARADVRYFGELRRINMAAVEWSLP